MKKKHFLAVCLIAGMAGVLATACKNNKDKRQESADPTDPARTEETRGLPDRPENFRPGRPPAEDGERQVPPHERPGERDERPQGMPPGGPRGHHFNDSLRPRPPHPNDSLRPAPSTLRGGKRTHAPAPNTPISPSKSDTNTETEL